MLNILPVTGLMTAADMLPPEDMISVAEDSDIKH